MAASRDRQPVRLPEPGLAVRGIALHARGDPDPGPDLLVLCTAPEHRLPDCAGLVVRESAVTSTIARIPETAAVFAAPDTARWSDIYDHLRRVFSRSVGPHFEHDAFHLADALAAAVGGAVAIEDVQRRVLAFSAVPGQAIDEVRRRGILGRQVPEHAERGRWYARLWRSTGVCEFTDGTESGARLAIAVRTGAEPLGSIWAVGDRKRLNPGADETLAGSVDVVAACLAHQSHLAARGREPCARLLRRLFGPEPGAAGYTLPGPTVLVALARHGESPDREPADLRLADVLSLKARRFEGSGIAAVLDGRVYGLLPAAERVRLDAYLRDVVSRAALPAGRIAVSEAVEHVDQLAGARRRVDRLLAVRAGDGVSAGALEIVHAGEERDRLALAELAEVARKVEALRDGVAGRIAQHDRDHGTAYVPTIRAWFETSGDVPAAAARLHVHPNTFRYRMTRASELFGLRLDQPDQRLLLHLQLRLTELE